MALVNFWPLMKAIIGEPDVSTVKKAVDEAEAEKLPRIGDDCHRLLCYCDKQYGYVTDDGPLEPVPTLRRMEVAGWVKHKKQSPQGALIWTLTEHGLKTLAHEQEQRKAEKESAEIKLANDFIFRRVTVDQLARAMAGDMRHDAPSRKLAEAQALIAMLGNLYRLQA